MRRWMRRSMTPSDAGDTASARGRAAEPTGGSLGAAFASDPATWEEAFESHWSQAEAIMRAAEHSMTTVDHIVAAFKHFDQMLWLLMTEVNAQPEPEIGPILDRFFTDDILMQTLQWCLSAPFLLAPTCQVQMLRLFEGIVTQSHTPHHCLLVHKPILIPLLRLLEWCNASEIQSGGSKSGPTEVEKHFVLLLNQICTKMAEDTTLLEFFFSGKRDGAADESTQQPRFLVFTLMIPYLYESGDIGQLARDALLLVLAVSRKQPSIAAFIAQHSNFCAVLAAGLSGCFSQLPRRVASEFGVSGDDWYGVTSADIETDSAIQEFYSSLLFCNAVIQVCHKFVLQHLLEFVYHGFLVSVVKPALYESSMEELISATAYLELCLRTITEPSLIKVFARFLLIESEAEKRVLETLIDRINSPSRLSLVSLRLFMTIVQLNCEDLMLELIYKYLIPCTHVMGSQIDHICDVDYYGESAKKFVSLMPRCCLLANGKFESDLNSEPNDSSSSHSDFSTEASVCADLNETYLVYLKEAGLRVGCNVASTRNWKWPYDGRTPDPSLYQEGDDDADDVSPAAENGGGFVRQTSLRRSTRPNQYFARRHTSNMTAVTGAAHGATLIDLTVLGPDFLLPLEEDSAFDEFWNNAEPEASSPVDAISSSTPRYEKTAATDYFRFAYDEDAESAGRLTAGEEESDANSGGTATTGGGGSATSAGSYVLRGWSEVNDLDTFVEILNRVRTSKESANHTLEENLDFIDTRLAELTNANNENETDPLKDSGVELAASMSASTMMASEVSTLTIADECVTERTNFQEVAIPLTIRGCFSSPNLGPFLTALLCRLENMTENTLFVNLQLTGLLSLLASYPQPLLSSLLLSSTLVFQPSVRSLFQILNSLKNKIDSHAFSVENFDSLLLRGRRFLGGRERRGGKVRSLVSRAARQQQQPSPFSALEIQGFTTNGDGTERPTTVKPRSISEIFAHRMSAVETKPRADSHETAVGAQKGYKYYQHKALESQSATLEAMRTKSVVYCALILQEFVQELAATSQQLPLAHVPIEPRNFL